MKYHSFAAALVLALGLAVPLSAQQTGANPPAAQAADAEKAWAEVLEASQFPPPPQEWQTTRPSEEEIEKFKAERGELAEKAAGKAREFYTRYPQSEHVEEAREREFQLLQGAAQMGRQQVAVRLEQLEKARLEDPNLGEDQRIGLAMQRAQRRAMSKMPEIPAALAELQKEIRDVIKQFPDREEPYQMLMMIASNLPTEEGKPLAKEVAEKAKSEDLKAAAEAFLARLDMIGKPLDLKFDSLEGKTIDLKDYRGKVVLVDFWATWCGPCIQELPNVKAAYKELHPKGFEILGISFDSDRGALQKLVKDEGMTWPQYFDGKGWQNEIGQRFGINSIPSMWLVDKKGVLRDMNAREDLAGKVEKLLAEKAD